MKQKYTRDQWLTLVAAGIFLIGAVFMLVNVFGAQTWALIIGLGLAVVATVIMIVAMIDNKKRIAANMAQSNEESANEDGVAQEPQAS